MIRHAMAYVQMAEKVFTELDRTSDYELGARVARSAGALREAESALVDAYGRWREAMQAAADHGSERAKRYLERTQWDLT